MHPLLNQHIARLHREELQREAAVTHAIHRTHANAQEDADGHQTHRLFWYQVFGLPLPTSAANQAQASLATTPAWFQGRLRATLLSVGCGAFGIGSLIGSFLGARFGLLPATLLGCIICLTISLPMLRRSLDVLNFSTLKRVVKGPCSCRPRRESIHTKP